METIEVIGPCGAVVLPKVEAERRLQMEGWRRADDERASVAPAPSLGSIRGPEPDDVEPEPTDDE